MGFCRTCRLPVSGSVVNWSEGYPQDMYIGNCVCYSHKKSDYEPLRMYSAIYLTPSPPEATQQSSMSGRMTPQSSGRDSRLENYPSSGTTIRIGTEYGTQPRTVDLTRSPRTFESVLTRNSEGSPTTFLPRNLLNDMLNASGELPALASPVSPGNRPVGTPIPRFPARNFGTDTMDTPTSLSTSLRDRYQSNIYYDGLTDTPLMSRRRVQPQFLGRRGSGSPRTWTHANGIPWRHRNNLGR